jgi:DNA polymerase III subunit epsilon
MPKYIFSEEPVPERAILLDTETTGYSPNTGARVVELAAIELIKGTPSGRTFHRYINPQCPVPYQAERVHGLSNRFLADKPVFAQIAKDWYAFIEGAEDELWAHNAPFDYRFMEGEISRLKLRPHPQIKCSLKLARALYGKGSYGLEVLAARIGHRYGGRGAHSALADCEALGSVLTTLLWPAEAERATTQGADPARPVAATKPRQIEKPDAAVVAAQPLPAGFKPLTGSDDQRIRRYDGIDLSAHLTSRGKRWDQAEEAVLVTRFVHDGVCLLDIVAELGRSPAALLIKLETLGIVAAGHPYTRSF